MPQARGTDQVDSAFFFQLRTVLPLTGLRISLLPASLRDVETRRSCKSGPGGGQRSGLHVWHDLLSDLSMPLQLFCVHGKARSSPKPSARPSATADSEKRQICITCLFADRVGLLIRRRRYYTFFHRGSNFRLRGGWGNMERFDEAARSETPKPLTVTGVTAQWPK